MRSLKNAIVTRHKEKLRNHYKLKESQEIGQLYILYWRAVNAIKDVIGTIHKTRIQTVDQSILSVS